jgi:hypothetical protein
VAGDAQDADPPARPYAALVGGPNPVHPDRSETATERLDRHWIELLQEVRVVQTGVQLLTGFLLTLPFQQRFATLGEPERAVYLVAVVLSAASTAALITPVAMHRLLFRRHARGALVAAGQRLALTGIWLLGLAITLVVGLIFDVVAGRTAGLATAGVALAMFVTLWVVVPLVVRARQKA